MQKHFPKAVHSESGASVAASLKTSDSSELGAQAQHRDFHNREKHVQNIQLFTTSTSAVNHTFRAHYDTNYKSSGIEAFNIPTIAYNANLKPQTLFHTVPRPPKGTNPTHNGLHNRSPRRSDPDILPPLLLRLCTSSEPDAPIPSPAPTISTS